MPPFFFSNLKNKFSVNDFVRNSSNWTKKKNIWENWILLLKKQCLFFLSIFPNLKNNFIVNDIVRNSSNRTKYVKSLFHAESWFSQLESYYNQLFHIKPAYNSSSCWTVTTTQESILVALVLHTDYEIFSLTTLWKKYVIYYTYVNHIQIISLHLHFCFVCFFFLKKIMNSSKYTRVKIFLHDNLMNENLQWGWMYDDRKKTTQLFSNKHTNTCTRENNQ